MNRTISGRKLVLGCIAFMFLLATIGIVLVFRETARLRERRDSLLKESRIHRLTFDFLRSANPVRTSPVVWGDEPIALWEVYSIEIDFHEIVIAAAQELERLGPAIRAPEQRGASWEYVGTSLQVIIMADTAYPEFIGQGDKVVFDDLPPLVTRPGYSLVRINYKRL